jgi:hypothetical protein
MIAKQINGNAGEIGWRIANLAAKADTTPVWTSKTVVHKIVGSWEVLEFGEITLPPAYDLIENIDELSGWQWDKAFDGPDAFRPYLDFYGSAANIAESILGFVLLPADEFFAEVFYPGDGSVITGTGRNVFEIDSVEYQKSTMRGTQYGDYLNALANYPDKAHQSQYQLSVVTTGKLEIPHHKTSHLHFLSMKYDATTGAWIYDDDIMLFLKAYRSAQYQLPEA